MDEKFIAIQETDINDVFCEISFLEEQIRTEAFQKGFSKGHEEGKLDGYHVGFHKGLQLGIEIGFYKGLVERLFDNFEGTTQKNSEKIYGLLVKIRDALEQFSKENYVNIDVEKHTENVRIIRSYYRKLKSLLKLNFSFSETSALSF